MKKRQLIRFGVLLSLVAGRIVAGSGVLYAQNVITLDDAIRNGAGEIEDKLTRGSKVVVLNFRSQARRFSNYVLDEMMSELVQNGRLTVVDRANLELIEQEMDFQLSGDVSDSSAQSIGQKLGAQSIVSGNIEDMGTHYRIRFRTISVETAAIQVMSTYNIQKDTQVATLMGGTGSAPVQAPAPVNPASPATQGPGLYPGGLNFSSGRKVGAGFLNWVFGLGSFTMGDWVGGLLVGGAELVGIIVYATATYEEYVDNGYYGGHYEYSVNEGQLLLGLGLQLGGVIFGHIRPYSYDKALAKKNGTYVGFGENPVNNITVTPVYHKGTTGMAVLYSVSY